MESFLVRLLHTVSEPGSAHLQALKLLQFMSLLYRSKTIPTLSMTENVPQEKLVSGRSHKKKNMI